MPTLPAIPQNVLSLLQTIIMILGAYFVIFWVGLVVWTFRDIKRRTHDPLAQILASLLVLFFHLPGLLIYYILRPGVTLVDEYNRSLEEEALLQSMDEALACPNCHKRVQPDFAVCPYCNEQLKEACPSCGRLLNLNWGICPYCATPLHATAPEETLLPPPALPEEADSTSEPAYSAS